jgi:membrane-bound serine protease (ClpP class)
MGAAALMVVGIAMLIAEAFVPSFGALGLGGFVAFVMGSIFLVDPTNEAGLRVSLNTIIPGAVVIGGSFLALGFILVKSVRGAVHSGAESLIHAEGHALRDFNQGKGQIRVQGAIWSATMVPSSEEIKKEDRVKVMSRKGLELTVKKMLS